MKLVHVAVAVALTIFFVRIVPVLDPPTATEPVPEAVTPGPAGGTTEGGAAPDTGAGE